MIIVNMINKFHISFHVESNTNKEIYICNAYLIPIKYEIIQRSFSDKNVKCLLKKYLKNTFFIYPIVIF